MARIAGVDLPVTKRVEIALTYIYGIGRSRSNVILKEAGVSPDIRVKNLTEDDVRKVSRVIEEQGGHIVQAHIADRIDRNFVRVLVGDRVEVELSAADKGRGRIVRKI